MNIQDSVALFSRQIQCGSDIYTWHYDKDLTLLSSNCPSEQYVDTALSAFGGKEALKEHFQESSRPLILSASIGLLWCCAKSDVKKVSGQDAALGGNFTSPSEDSIYLIGPVWSTEANLSSNFPSMAVISRERNLPMEWLNDMAQALKALPVVMPSLMNQYALMLHCTVTGEQLNLSDLAHQKSRGSSEKETSAPRDRRRTWQIEQQMLQMVREGDLGYSKILNQAANASRGVPVKGKTALRGAKTSVIVFTSLCTRAAIEGGLSPDEAYSLGDEYIQCVEDASTVSEIASFSYGMYSDFISRVRSKRLRKEIPSHLRAVCDYIEMHLEEPLSTSLLAQKAGYSEQYLRRKFAEAVGTSLPDYIRSLRLERSKTLLLNTDLSIPEIAETLQFCSRSHFSDCFSKEYGISPARFREENSI